MKEVTLNTKINDSLSIIANAIEVYPRLGVFCSFGKDSMVVLHLSRRIKSLPVYTVMTKFKPQETFVYKDMISHLWGLDLREYSSTVDVPLEMARNNPNKCCSILKVEPTQEALKELDAWITGLRRTEGRTRTDYMPLEEGPGVDKINPILDWTELDIWKYMAMNAIPVHPWYIKGYRSLGCWPCTNIVDDSDTERAGRWKDTSKCGGECGIHTMFK